MNWPGKRAGWKTTRYMERQPAQRFCSPQVSVPLYEVERLSRSGQRVKLVRARSE